MCSKSFELLYSNKHKYCSGPEEKMDKNAHLWAEKESFSSCPVYSGVCVQFPLQLFILYSQWSNILSVLSSPPTRVTPRHSTSDAGKPVCLFICSTLIIHTAMFSSVLYTLNTNYSASWLCSRSAPSTADLSLFSSVLACKFVSLVLFSYCWFRDLVKGVCFA